MCNVCSIQPIHGLLITSYLTLPYLENLAPLGLMLTKRKKKCKNLKSQNFEKRKKEDLEIWWIGGFAQNLGWIH